MKKVQTSFTNNNPMKKIAFLVLFCSLNFLISAQQTEDPNALKTKFSNFTSQSGSILSFEDINTTTFSTFTGTLIAKKRTVKKANEQKNFLMLEISSSTYSTRIAAISEDDISELLKATTTLQNDAIVDINTNSEYMEKYYQTEDNFKIGYYISSKKLKWYVDLDTRLSGSTFFIKDFDFFVTTIKSIMK
jgi:hypothetical protein